MSDTAGALDAKLREAEKADAAPPADDATPRDAAPSRKRGSRGGKGKSKGSGGRRSLQKPLQELIEQVAGAVMILDPFDGAVIAARAEKLARALDGVARENESVHRALERLTATGGWGGVLVAVGSIAVPIAMHHGVIPAHPLLEAALVPDEARDVADTPGLGSLLSSLGALADLDEDDLAAMADAAKGAPEGVPTGRVNAVDGVGA